MKRNTRAARRETVPVYRGSPKHKNRPAIGAKGTLCPEWTHGAPDAGLGTDMSAHPWQRTRAWALFRGAVVEPGTGRRFATERGIAFEAKPTGDRSWHGYPVPWESVPPEIKDGWIDQGIVSGRRIKAFYRFDAKDIHWALRTDD